MQSGQLFICMKSQKNKKNVFEVLKASTLRLCNRKKKKKKKVLMKFFFFFFDKVIFDPLKFLKNIIYYSPLKMMKNGTNVG